VTKLDLTGTFGSATLNSNAANGVWYSPGNAFNYLSVGEAATDTFAYTVSDAQGDTSTAQVTVTITGVNLAPVAVADTAAATAQQPVSINVLANDTDPNKDDTLSVTSLNLAGTLGTATLAAGSPGTVLYSPGSAFNYLSVGETATDRFSYAVSDGHGGTATATATVTVAGTNLPPVAHPDAAATDAQHGVWVNLTGNDTDPNRHDVLAVTAVGLTGAKGSAALVKGSTNGAWYTPGAAFNYLSVGETATDTFTYTISDGHGGTATSTATVTVTGVNLPPGANPDAAATDAQHGVSINLAANDTDPNKDDTLWVASVNLAGTLGTVTLVAGSPGTVLYAPGAAFNYLSVGETATDRFSYTVSDGHGGTAASYATVTVTGVNLAPAATPNTAATDAQHGLWLNLTANDTDPNRHDTLAMSAVDVSSTKGSVVSNPNATNGVWYSPNGAFNYLSVGETATDTFTYTISDGHGGTATSTATVAVTGVNLPPVANPDAAATDAQHGVAINLAANDADPNRDDTLSVASVNLAGTLGKVTLVAGSPGTVLYSPGAAFNYLSVGETATDRFSYTVSDGHGGTATSSATVTVTGVNLAPVATPNAAATDAQHGLWLNLTANDTDPNRHDTLAVSAVDLSSTKGSVTSNPNATNGVWYAPNAAFNYLSAGETATDRFSYTISDGHGGTASAPVTVTVTGVNLSPVAAPGTAATDAQHGVSIDLAADVSDPNRDDTLSITSLNQTGTLGSATLNPAVPEGVIYSPGSAFDYLSVGETATDRFSYTVSDNNGATATSSVTVTVTGANLSPIATPFNATTDADHGMWLNLHANFSDPNRHDVLSITSLDLDGTKGTVTLNAGADSGVWYSPGVAFQGLAAGQSGTDSFTYTVSDGHGGSTTGTATVTVSASGSSVIPGRAFYVATNGNDNWSGRLAQPNAAGTDGPFATLTAARNAMEADLTTQTTYIERGDYYLSGALNLTLKDSGQTWSAYDSHAVNIHGGTALAGWTNQGNGIWTIRPPAGAMTQGGAINTLYVNGVAQIDSRFPDVVPGVAGSGWLTASASLPGENTYTQFQFAPGSIPQFTSTAGLYAVVFSQNGWSDVATPVASIDYTRNQITLTGASPYTIGAGSRFYLYNVAGQVSTPGEYSYDPAGNVLTYDAPAGFDGTGATVGSQPLAIGIYGAHNVTLSGLTIGDAQSNGYGVQISGSSNVTVKDSKIDDTGTGILIDSGSNNVHLLNNELLNLNSYGILITPSANTITADGNYIHDVGTLTSGSGIWFTGSANDVFSNNLIENIAKIGIGGGSVLGASDASYNDVITLNKIIGANQQTADAGGIYLIGRQQDSTGDTISYNTVSGTSSLPPGSLTAPSAGIGAGIYLDDFASGVTVLGNLLQGNVDGIRVHLGSDNTIGHNVTTGSTVSALVLDGANKTGITALRPPSGNTFDSNTVYVDQPGSIAALIVDALAGASWSGDIYGGPAIGAQPFNVDIAGGTAGETFAQWQSLGFDTTSLAPSAAMTLAAALANLPSG